MSEPEVLLSGLGIPESPRWHEGRLWFCNWIDRQVVAVGLDGTAEVAAVGGDRGMGYSIDWLPDSRLLVTGDTVRCQEPDGSVVTIIGHPANEIVVDGRGNAYINGADFNFSGGEAPTPGWIRLITPDGEVRQVAGDIEFPNGMVITPDNRTLIISESFSKADRVRHRPGRGAVGAAGLRRGPRPGRHLPGRRGRRGVSAAATRSSGSPTAARSCSASNSARTGPRSR